MAKELNDKKGNISTYLDSESKESMEYEEHVSWKLLKGKDRFETKVLITTSVLDNGFNIKDPLIKNIVICTDDKTELLQELGRCRLEKDQNIILFIKR